MKKGILIIGAIVSIISVMAFSLLSRNNSEIVKETIHVENTLTAQIEKEIFTDFNFDVGPRFAPISKTALFKATSISDFISPESFNSIIDLKFVKLIIIKNERQTELQEIGYTNDLTANQLKLLRASDYGTQFNIRSEFTAMNAETGILEDRFDSPHLSVVPEKQAEYPKGKDALISFLKENSKAIVKSIDAKKLQPAKLYFTVAKNGAIKNVRLDRTSNYPDVDKIMVELIQKTPENWIPAENSKGEKIDQELAVFFGLLGC